MSVMHNRKQKGMSLIELMIVVAIIGILAAIAYPSYQSQIRKSRRTEAKVALEQGALALEKCYTRSMTYVGCPAPVAATEEGHYTVALAGGVSGLATSFVLTATPAGSQVQDAECGAFTLSDTGVRGVSGSGTAQACW